MSNDLIFILISSAGACTQEVLHWYNLRNKLIDKEVKKLAKSKWYWIITFIMIIVSGLGTYLLFFKDIPDKHSVQFILGAAFPSLFKKLVETKTNEGQDLGQSKGFGDVIKLYLQ